MGSAISGQNAKIAVLDGNIKELNYANCIGSLGHRRGEVFARDKGFVRWGLEHRPPVTHPIRREMKLKQLESLLGTLQQFSHPKVELEQYPTGPHIASRLLYTAENTFGDINGKVVADFGCGCGTLGLASALLGAEQVIGIDIDPQSLEIASINAADMELDIDFIWCDINKLRWRDDVVDTVVMNPPFGTRKKGSDMEFLAKALKVASQAVYSLHKTTTRDYIKRTAIRDCNARSADILCELRFDVPQIYKFHKKKEVNIVVDLWRFVPYPTEGSADS
ncbi:hypothetical protein OPV22_023457 [Ensete ventricosum]|uniref:Methyltransferase-like protein 5 n=1 Tax=Ensete ventricosum TaxID=4639 RepID=A0AAV8QNL0_ENSVE|nr:hypothetical protein OPV22_023457 [Ensete ventricosum]